MNRSTFVEIGRTLMGQPVFFDASDDILCTEQLQEGVLVIPQAAIILARAETGALALVTRLIEDGRCILSRRIPTER